MSASEPPPFDPLKIIAVLEQRRVAYVLIGGLARIIHGTDEITNGVDICPQLRPENLERLRHALDDLGATDGHRLAEVTEQRLASEGLVRLTSPWGDIGLVATPAGSSGHDDLRRKSTREPVGRGVRVAVVDPIDLARIASASGRREEARAASVLRRLAELDRHRGR